MNDVYFNYARVSVLFLDGVGWVERLGIVVDVGVYLGFPFHYLAAWIPSFCGIALMAGL